MIKDILKRETVTIDLVGSIEIKELSARAQIEIAEAYRKEKSFDAAFIACKHGVVGWSDSTVEDISSSMPMKVINEIAQRIYKLSGFDEDEEKNLESAPSAVSSFGSRRT
jgi:hypothetical protein